ncbi:MAG: hypothetical protein MZU91_08880 [Desulfosudis oleivorans]|nr:hypothetical protein [Desulfosudis oleivorans]
MAEECSVLSDRETEALTVFCAVESIDEEDLEGVVLQAIEEIKKTAGQVNVRQDRDLPVCPPLQRPRRHPRPQLLVFNAPAGQDSKPEGFAVKRAPFGWYKSFKLSCKGHPLSELSKTIMPGEEGTVKKEKKEVTHDWFVHDP